MSFTVSVVIAATLVACVGNELDESLVTPVPFHSGASGGRNLVDESQRLQALLESGAETVDLGTSGVVSASVTVPAGVTLRSTGTVLVPPPGASYAVRSGGNGVQIVGVKVDASRDGGLTGGESAFLIAHSGVVLKDSTVTGNGYRYGVMLNSNGLPLRDISITGNDISTTSYGILKSGVRTESLKIENNTFSNIRRGDAIELDTGGESGTVIRHNTIVGVHQDGTEHAGLGIGIAGEGDYGLPASAMTGPCIISNNSISNVEREAIHLENMKGCLVLDNSISVTKDSSTDVGIALYGTKNTFVSLNKITGARTGVFDALGVKGGEYVLSASGNLSAKNQISDCEVGIASMVAGDRSSVTFHANSFANCTRGIFHSGATNATITENVTKQSLYPYSVDLLPPDTRQLGTATRALKFTGNLAYRNGLLVSQDLTLSNVAGARIDVARPNVAKIATTKSNSRR